MTDGDKIAAAILAVEAVRQSGDAAELSAKYASFLVEVVKASEAIREDLDDEVAAEVTSFLAPG